MDSTIALTHGIGYNDDVHFVIVGAGSSAGRFISILLQKNHHVSVYKHKKSMVVPQGCDAIDSLDDLTKIDGGIISSPTSTHYLYAKKFIDQCVPVLVEKPLTDKLSSARTLLKMAKENKTILHIGLNLRFLPIVEKIKKYIESNKLGRILHAELYVGQYLPTWRPWLDYRTNYSASYERGGGVALDLIHEIDLAHHFFENISLTPIVAKKLSDLDIDVEDFVQLRTKKEPHVLVTLDYLHHSKTRQYRIVGDRGSINCDIINHRFEFRNIRHKEEIIVDPAFFAVSDTFEKEIDYFIAHVKRKHFIAPTERLVALDALAEALKARKHVQR